MELGTQSEYAMRKIFGCRANADLNIEKKNVGNIMYVNKPLVLSVYNSSNKLKSTSVYQVDHYQ